MQTEISDRVFLGQTVSPLDDVGNSSVIDGTASNYSDEKERLEK